MSWSRRLTLNSAGWILAIWYSQRCSQVGRQKRDKQKAKGHMQRSKRLFFCFPSELKEAGESQQDLASVHSSEDGSMGANLRTGDQSSQPLTMIFLWLQKYNFLESLVVKIIHSSATSFLCRHPLQRSSCTNSHQMHYCPQDVMLQQLFTQNTVTQTLQYFVSVLPDRADHRNQQETIN